MTANAKMKHSEITQPAPAKAAGRVNAPVPTIKLKT